MELYRKELKLAVIKGLDESRGSSNVPIKLTHDTSDEYINYTEQIHVRYLLDNQVKEEILPTNDNGFYIPGKPLSHDGPIELAVHLINGDIELVTNELSFVVKNAPNGTTQVDPSEFTWQQLVDQYVNAKLDTFANKLDLSKFEEKVNGSIENQSQNIESFITEVNAKINQTTSVQNSKITTLEGRMDTFTRLSEGSTTGDAELQDIRVGANGVTYNNAGDAVRGQYSQLKEDLGDLDSSIYEKNKVGCTVSDIDGATYIASAPVVNIGRYTGIKLGYNANYDTYYLVLNEDTEIYFETLVSAYVSLCIARGYTGEATDSSGVKYLLGSNPVRYRKSESNLPTVSSKLVAYKGDVIAVTVTKGGSDVIYGLKTDKTVKQTFADEVREKFGISIEKVCSLVYGAVDTDIGDAGKEQVSIFVPAIVGFVKYAFVRNEVSASNANNWRIDRAYACDDSKVVRFPITAQGEWEMALKINERADFIGGYAHGDEVLKSISFFVDGRKVNDISSLTTETEFEELRIVELTDLYDPNDGANLSTKDSFTPVAHHGREYIITKDGIRLKQFVLFDVAETMTTSYMTMLPIIRGNDYQWATQITDSYYSDDNYAISDVSTPTTGADAYNWRANCTRGVIWSDVSGVSAEVEMLYQKKDNLTSEHYHKVQSSNTYNKFYWTVCCIGNQTADIQKNHRFETDTMFKINVCK